MTPRVLVTAKAPVAGLAKTRLGAVVGPDVAADLAAAALLDTLAACGTAFEERYLALDGDLARAHRSADLHRALDGWHVFAQEGETFSARLAHAHGVLALSGAGPIVQVGMDTPQVTPALLRETLAGLEPGVDAVLGPAEDGGWWVLALADGTRAEALRGVEMSTPRTYGETIAALTRTGMSVASAARLRDVDTVPDAEAVALAAPGTLFAQAWGARAKEAS